MVVVFLRFTIIFFLSQPDRSDGSSGECSGEFLRSLDGISFATFSSLLWQRPDVDLTWDDDGTDQGTERDGNKPEQQQRTRTKVNKR